METLSENKCFGGTQGVYRHSSKACLCDMTFAVFLPEEAVSGPVPVLWYLSGLTCTHENAMVKAGAQAWAAEAGIALIFPDTSPRGEGVSDDEAYDLGQGAGFYVNATQDPWAPHFQMWDYISAELPSVIAENFNIDVAPIHYGPFYGGTWGVDAGPTSPWALRFGLCICANL
jgi:S-formylglutathione hydrolase